MELISTSHHKVYYNDALNEYIKVARDKNDFARGQLLREHKANLLLGRKSSMGFYENTPCIITPNLGKKLEKWNEKLVNDAMNTINNLPQCADSNIPPATILPQLIKESLIDRNSTIPTKLLESCNSGIFSEIYLIHRDLHIHNWVMGNNSELQLIDWVAALIGNLDVCRANFIFGLVDKGYDDYVRIVCDHIENFNIVKELLLIKTISFMSWAEWSTSFETPERQLFIGLKSIMLLNGN